MGTADRRREIISILLAKRQTTAKELAEMLEVSVRTIHYDVQALTKGYPIYTVQGGNGGIFIEESYRPYINTLSERELQTLLKLYHMTKGQEQEVLYQIICKYGPNGQVSKT